MPMCDGVVGHGVRRWSQAGLVFAARGSTNEQGMLTLKHAPMAID